MNQTFKLLIIVFCLLLGKPSYSQIDNSGPYKKYLSYKDVVKELRVVAKSNSKLSIENLAISAGDNPVVLFKAMSGKKNPAIFVSANLSGVLPIATSGALYLAAYLSKKPELYKDYTWYILPCGNPDALISDLKSTSGPYNATAVNNDMDEKTDEDGFDDLNKDGIYSAMRVQDPLGKYMIDKKNPRLLKKASTETPSSKRYSLYTEGLDNDGDGLFNEDGKGGVNISRTFPYNFEYYKPENGKWSGKEAETRAILDFFSEHPEICATVTIGSSDFLRSDFIPVKKDAKANAYSPPKWLANNLSIDAKQKYTLERLVELLNADRVDNMVDELYVLSIMKKEPLKSPLSQDGNDYKTIATSFKEFVKKDSSALAFIDSEKPSNGSFELWSYYHLGLPSIAIRLWDIPNLTSDTGKVAKKQKKLNREQSFLIYNDSLLNGKGFTEWTGMSHPDFDKSEIGGINKNYMYNPDESGILPALEKQIPWITTLPEMLPEIVVDSIHSKAVGKSTYQIEAFVKNKGKLAAPFFIGAFNRKPAPIILTVNDDITVLEGSKRTLIKRIEAGKVIKVNYLISTKKSEITFKFEAKNVKTSSSSFKIK